MVTSLGTAILCTSSISSWPPSIALTLTATLPPVAKLDEPLHGRGAVECHILRNLPRSMSSRSSTQNCLVVLNTLLLILCAIPPRCDEF